MARKTSKKTVKKAGTKVARKASGQTAAKAAGSARRKTGKKKASSRVKDLCIELSSEQGIRDVAELHQRLLAAADHATLVTIDASSIERVDTAVLQLLTAFVIERNRTGKAVDWKQPSETFYRAASLVDLATRLQLPQPAVSK